MIGIALISLFITPVVAWLLLYTHITDQVINDEIIETKAEAQKAVLSQTLKHPLFYLWALYGVFCFVSFLGAYNVYGFMDLLESVGPKYVP